jgi:hypothetical protein
LHNLFAHGPFGPKATRRAGELEAGAVLGEAGTGDAVLGGELTHRRRPNLLIKLVAAESDRLTARLFGHCWLSFGNQQRVMIARTRPVRWSFGRQKILFFVTPAVTPEADSAKNRA